MKYPSIFLTIFGVWIVVDIIAIALNNHNLTWNLYIATIFFSLMIFLIGFWRNK